MARAKNLLSLEVIHLASTGRAGSASAIFGESPCRNLAGTIFADSGRAPFFLGALFDSDTTSTAPLLAAFCGVPLTRVFMKKVAIAQYSVCFQSVNGWLWHWAHCSCTPRNMRVVLSVILSTVGLATK